MFIRVSHDVAMMTWVVLAAVSAFVMILARATERAIAPHRALVRSILHGDRSVHPPAAHESGRCSLLCDRPVGGAAFGSEAGPTDIGDSNDDFTGESERRPSLV